MIHLVKHLPSGKYMLATRKTAKVKNDSWQMNPFHWYWPFKGYWYWAATTKK